MYPKNPFLIKGVGGKISLLYNSSKGNGRGIMKELEAAIELREKGQLEKSNEILVNLVKNFQMIQWLTINVHGVLMLLG